MRGSRIFSGGGGGGGVENSMDFFSPQLILQFTEGGPMVYFRENYTAKDPEGSNIFPGGVSNFF